MTMTKRTSPAAKENQMQQQLACPRCDSTNTKFCYYNNYNLSQPRHFCKSCRRYWTHGGALRDIPVGGGSRRSTTKRPRTNSPVFLGPTTTTTTTLVTPPPAASYPGSFGSLLGQQDPVPTTGFLAFTGFGLGFEGFGMGRGFGWANFPDDCSVADRMLVATNGGGHTWQFESGGVEPECFPWSDLAISTSGHGLKLN